MGVHEAQAALEACPECGSVVPAFGEALRARDEVIETLTEDVANLERELRRYRSNHNRLLRERDQERRESPNYRKAMEVLEYWRERCAPRARGFRGKRLENCLARLNEEFDVESLKRAVDGFASRPYVVNMRRVPRGHKDDWCADAELIFREPRHVERGIAIYEAEQDYQHALALGTISGDLSPSSDGVATTPLGSLGQGATHYASCGIYVFPCLPGQKIPATPRGLHDATLDIERIARFWSVHPDYNVALRCGRESAIVVLDVDPDRDGSETLRRLERQYGDLPVTASVVTPRGGQHFYFRHPRTVAIQNTVGFPGPGLDIRGDGGYVLASPSVVRGRSYVPDEQGEIAQMPGWLLGLLLEHQGRPGEARPEGHWGRVVELGARSGERNGQLTSYVGHLVSLRMERNEVRATAHMWNAQHIRPPLEGREVERTIDSIFRRDDRRTAA